jgi:lysine 2,3-aminomutase
MKMISNKDSDGAFLRKEKVAEKKEESNKEEEPGGTCRLKKEYNCYSSQNKAFSSIESIKNKIDLLGDEEKLKEVTNLYRMRVTEYYFSLIKDLKDANDPIRMQCVPSIEELDDPEDMDIEMDPLGEVKTSPVSCLVHRYPDRALLLVTGRCFMYCRHCTRKRLWKNDCSDYSLADIQKAINYIKNNKQIREIIISGGDPLVLATERLEYIIELVDNIKHIEVIRLGTRTPVVFPKRIDRSLCKTLQRFKKLWINLQFNHPNEITPESTAACQRLQQAGIPLSNQSVLLKGINDDVATMKELCQKLQSIRVRPYYLFQCDPVVGAAHFRTSAFTGIEIIENMRGHTSGMCIPQFVIDGTDGKGKIPLMPNYLLSCSDDSLLLRNYEHKVFSYKNPKA